MLTFPFLPLWEGAGIYAELPVLFAAVFALAHGFLIAGFIHHSLRIDESTLNLERWVWLIYPLGLGSLLIVLLLFPFWEGQTFSGDLTGVWFGLLTLGLSLGLLFFYQRRPQIPEAIANPLKIFLSLNWLYRLFWSLFRLVGRFLDFVSQILEGDGGILWALLLMILIISLILRQGGAG